MLISERQLARLVCFSLVGFVAIISSEVSNPQCWLFLKRSHSFLDFFPLVTKDPGCVLFPVFSQSSLAYGDLAGAQVLEMLKFVFPAPSHVFLHLPP